MIDDDDKLHQASLLASAFLDEDELYGSDPDSCDDLEEDSEDDIFFVLDDDEMDQDNVRNKATCTANVPSGAPSSRELGPTLLQNAGELHWKAAENKLGGGRGSYSGNSLRTQEHKVQKEIAHHA
jgi:hypothetical protein